MNNVQQGLNGMGGQDMNSQHILFTLNNIL